MNKIAVTAGLLISLVALAGCSSSVEAPLQQVAEPKKAQRMRVVSSAKAADVLPAFSTFTWNEEYNYVLSAANDNQEEQVKAYIRSELLTYLKSKGYQYQPDPVQADVVIGFLFALDDAIAGKTVQEKFGLLPGLDKSRRGYGKGTLLLEVLDAELKKVYWRSALQGFVDLEKDRQDINGVRMQNILEIMLGGFPKAGR